MGATHGGMIDHCFSSVFVELHKDHVAEEYLGDGNFKASNRTREVELRALTGHELDVTYIA